MNEKNKKRNIEEEVNYEDKKKYNNVGLTKCFIIGTQHLEPWPTCPLMVWDYI